jgi:hypothetical protein
MTRLSGQQGLLGKTEIALNSRNFDKGTQIRFSMLTSHSCTKLCYGVTNCTDYPIVSVRAELQPA